MTHCNRFVLLAHGHPLVTGLTEGRLMRVLSEARRKLALSDGTLGGLLGRYHDPVPPEDPTIPVTHFTVFWFADYKPVRSERLGTNVH